MIDGWVGVDETGGVEILGHGRPCRQPIPGRPGAAGSSVPRLWVRAAVVRSEALARAAVAPQVFGHPDNTMLEPPPDMPVNLRRHIPVLTVLLLGCSSGPSTADTTPAPTDQSAAMISEDAGYYTAEQSRRGQEVFEGICAECHYASEFRGRDFEWTWRRQTARDLFERMAETMPEDNPGSLTDQQYVDVVAYVLSLNEYPAGQVELEPAGEVLARVPLGPDARGGDDAR